MANRRKLTDAQIEQLIEWRERGRSYERIARDLGVSTGAVLYQCLKHGAVSPRQRNMPVPTETRPFVAGDGRVQRRFTQAEDARMLELEATGMPINRVADTIGRARTSVRIRLLMLGLCDEIAG